MFVCFVFESVFSFMQELKRTLFLFYIRFLILENLLVISHNSPIFYSLNILYILTFILLLNAGSEILFTHCYMDFKWKTTDVQIFLVISSIIKIKNNPLQSKLCSYSQYSLQQQMKRRTFLSAWEHMAFSLCSTAVDTRNRLLQLLVSLCSITYLSCEYPFFKCHFLVYFIGNKWMAFHSLKIVSRICFLVLDPFPSLVLFYGYWFKLVSRE